MASKAVQPKKNTDDDFDDADPDRLYEVAKELVARAAAARNKGDVDMSSRMTKAAIELMGGEVPEDTGRKRRADSMPSKFIELLKGDEWRDVEYIREHTGLPVNKVHGIMNRVKKQLGKKVSYQKIVRWKIPE